MLIQLSNITIVQHRLTRFLGVLFQPDVLFPQAPIGRLNNGEHAQQQALNPQLNTNTFFQQITVCESRIDV